MLGGVGSAVPDVPAIAHGGLMIDEKPTYTQFHAVRPLLDERSRQLRTAAESVSAGYTVRRPRRAIKVARESPTECFNFQVINPWLWGFGRIASPTSEMTMQAAR